MIISAPGKVILFGDHSVVYDRRAIAAAISLRTTLTFTHSISPTLVLDFPNIGLHLSIPSAFIDSLPRRHLPEPAHELDQEIMAIVERYLDEEHLEGVVKAAAAAFLYLYAHIGQQTKEKSFGTYHLDSELPIGAGLGSSATVSVIIVTTLLLNSGLIDPPSLSGQAGLGQEALLLINKWAYTGEQCIHGTPSGVDNTVATYGRAVSFQKSQAVVSLQMPSLPLLLVNTGVPRSTKTQVANVAKLRAAMPLVVEPILDSMHQIALQAQSLLSSGTAIDRNVLGSLMVVNQGLLATLGVSHTSIEAIITANHEKGWTKLIGAGGGGCVITLLNETHESLDSTLFDKDGVKLESYVVDLGGPGVGYHTENGIEYWA